MSKFMDEVYEGYVDAALWSSNDESDESGGAPMDRNYSIADIAEETRKRMRKDCESFVEKNADLLVDMDPGQIGHDFWLTRNGHGVGFWDRGLGEVGDKLSDSCRKFKEFYIYVGDDGKIHGN